MHKLLFSRAARKDASKIRRSNLDVKCKALLELLSKDPFDTTYPFEKLVGDLSGFYSRRINIQHRLIYAVDQDNKIVKILRMWMHYE
jgi:Txe/YoeB family toxin of toxin-antitoxin system